ncbi:pre-mRNA-splicing ATP-dependent RNA helicase prp28-like [Arachis ipaensis]|uniref:pre-mRNA-splicing ATP-dependent RNA helicase prp28-like n=1 Tax=Arachis ipaensis TaxID=130454 RepID=UPI0007AFCE8C|nr:pre-mRNA-splicing ATP-dependent RNA helicase prp28-like [Arachis ipaensis]XP_025678714.1 pre-mRNA-splicing ATP-dependent RNA helicase prp28-like [Arachis hypogaea]
MITRLATLSGVERHPTDRTSVFISKQPFLPYGDYKGPQQKKRKTTEPPSSTAEPSAPPVPPGRDAGPPPPDTPEPETEPATVEVPAAEAGQTVEPTQQRAEERADQPIVEELVVERAEPAAIAEPRVETTTDPSRAIIVYQRHHHPPPPDGGDSQS